jgi:hypothetical protein
MRSLLVPVLSLPGSLLLAADGVIGDPATVTPRIAAEAMVGTAGFEGGLAAEFIFHDPSIWQIRPEVFINDDSRVGLAVSLSWDLNAVARLPDGHEFFIGPRVAYHNSDHDKLELDAMGIYSFPLFQDKPIHHHIEIIGTVGVLEHRDDNDNVSSRIGASIGLGYAYQF